MSPSPARRLALAVTGLLVLGACGGSPGRSATTVGASVQAQGPATSSPSTVGSSAGTTASATTAAGTTSGAPPTLGPTATSPLPDVAVLDAGTGETVQLAALLPADRPLLVWFWAPH